MASADFFTERGTGGLLKRPPLAASAPFRTESTGHERLEDRRAPPGYDLRRRHARRPQHLTGEAASLAFENLIFQRTRPVAEAERDPAAFVIASRHPEILLWVARMAGGEPREALNPAHHGQRDLMRKKSEAQARKSNGTGHAKPGAYVARRAKRDCDDEALLEAMRRNSEATIGELAMAIGKSQNERGVRPPPPARRWGGRKCRGTLATRCGT